MRLSKSLLATSLFALTLSACGGASPTTQAPSVPPPQTSQQSLKDLIATGSPQKCTVSYANDNNAGGGTVYVASGKMRGDFSQTVDGKTIQSHMIVSDGTSYIWSDGMPSGFKMQIPKSGSTSPDQARRGAPDLEKKATVSCSAWTEDDAQLTPPSNVTFNEFSLPTPPVPGKALTGNAQQCSICNSLPAAQKAQCKKAMHCK